jgi:hypothetical protein
MKLAQALAALALTGAFASAAHADTIYNIPSPLTTTPYTNTTTVTAGSVFTIGANAFNFTDTYNFSIINTLIDGTAVTINLDLGNFGYHISNLKLDLFDTSNTWLDGDIVTDASDTSVSIDLGAPLAAGSYYFLVRGFADGQDTNQGIYTFSTAALTTPVPEAKTYSMLLAGLGMIGTMVLRRRV